MSDNNLYTKDSIALLKDYFNVEFDLPIEGGEGISSELSDALGYDSYCKIIS